MPSACDQSIPQLDHLLGRAQQGDMVAFSQIVRRFEGMAGAFAFARLGDVQLAEDATQASFFEAYCNLAKVYNGAAFPAWLRKIVFKHTDRIRRKRKAQLSPLAEITLAELNHPAQQLEEKETALQVRSALLALPLAERQVAVLFYWGGYSRHQIADFVDKPVAEVIYRLRSARRLFKQRMTKMTSQQADPTAQTGSLALAELGLEADPPELAHSLGALKERSSSGQNLLHHSMDVARLAAAIAEQLGWDKDQARRAGLLHDIGKVVADAALPHTVIGANMAIQWGESVAVQAVIATHHERGRRLTPTCQLLVVSPLCFVVRVADAMAAQLFPDKSGPDQLEEYGQIVPPKAPTKDKDLAPYYNRILNLEDLTQTCKGVSAAYLFPQPTGAALLLRTTPAAGEVETLAFNATQHIQKTWSYPHRITTTPISTRFA